MLIKRINVTSFFIFAGKLFRPNPSIIRKMLKEHNNKGSNEDQNDDKNKDGIDC